MRAAYRHDFSHWTSKTLWMALALCATSVMATYGCGRQTDTTPAAPPTSAPAAETTAPAAAGAFKIGLVMSGPTTDNGWNAGALKAWQSIRKELSISDADSPYVENQTSPSDQEKSLRAFAAKCNVVFGHGHEYQDLALRMESDFPKTLFVISSGDKVGAHTMPIVYKLEDGAYLLGMLAGGMSKSGKLAEVGAEKIPPVASVFKAFEAGAQSINPKIVAQTPSYTGSWDDPGKAKQATLPLIDQGADIVMQDVDAAAPGVFNAVKERNKPDKPVYALGTNSNQNSAAPDVILASAPIYTDKVFVAIAKQAKDGTLKANDTPFGMHEGIIDFVLNPQLESKIPADLKTKLDDTKKKITDGSFVVPKGS